MLKLYSIVTLSKQHYIREYLQPRDGMNPRLLVVAVHQDGSAIVRYPIGRCVKVQEAQVNVRGRFDMDHPSYAKLAENMRAILSQFRRDPEFRQELTAHLPDLAGRLQASMDLYDKLHKSPEELVPATQPQDAATKQPPDEPSILSLIQSIDRYLACIHERLDALEQVRK